MRVGTRRYEQIEVEETGRAEPRLSRRRRIAQRKDGLPGAIVARARHPAARLLPQLADRPLLADHHPGSPVGGRVGERAAAVTRRDDVGAYVAESLEPTVGLGEAREAPEPTPCDVLEEDALHRLLGAEGEDLVERRRDRFRHGRIIPPG